MVYGIDNSDETMNQYNQVEDDLDGEKRRVDFLKHIDIDKKKNQRN